MSVRDAGLISKAGAGSSVCLFSGQLRPAGPEFMHGVSVMRPDELEKYTGQLLETARFQDYCPNGLQVEGLRAIGSLATGVTASLDLLRAAVAAGADAVLVHHGYFWSNEDARLTGIKRARIAYLLQHGISLLAYHLPLDAHPELGNNAQLALRLGAAVEGRFGGQAIAAYGSLDEPVSLAGLGERISRRLERAPLLVGGGNQPVRRIAWCSGAAQNYFEEAIRLKVDAFVTGEISEQCVHLAREAGVAFVCAGHHATERYGVQALGEHLAQRFGLQHRFIDID